MAPSGVPGRPASAPGRPTPHPLDLRLLLPALAAWAGAVAGLRGQVALVAGSGLALAALALVSAALAASRPTGSFATGSRTTGSRTTGSRTTGSRTTGRRATDRKAPGWRATVVVVGCCLCCAGAAGAIKVAGRDAGPVPGLAGERAHVRAWVTLSSDPRTLAGSAAGFAGPRTWAFARIARLEQTPSQPASGHSGLTRLRTPVLLRGDGTWPTLLPGARLLVSGQLRPARPGEAIAAILSVDKLTVVSDGGRLSRAVEPLRRGLREAAQGLPEGAAGLLPALVVGDESGLDEAVVNDLRQSGLTHLTAVSGANLAITIGAGLAMARLLGLRSWAIPALGVFLLAGFVVLARPQPSVVRAGAMALVVLLAYGTGSGGSGLRVLSLAILGLVLFDPWLALSPGFALSVAATTGLLALAPGWAASAGRWLPRPLAAAVAVTLAAQVACTPVLSHLSGAVGVAALPANLLAQPAVPPATVLGICAAVVSLGSPGAAHVVAVVAGLPTEWIVRVAAWGAGLPGSEVPAPVWLATAGTALAAVLSGRLLRSRALCLAVACALALLLTRPDRLAGWPPRGWIVVMCDVGQGDALVLRAGPGSAVVVDAGGDPRAVDSCLRALGIDDVPAVLLTHFHADHVGGLAGVLEDRDVGMLLVSPLAEPAAQAAEVHRVAREHGVAVRVAQAGEQRAAGWTSWRTLWPRRLIRGEGSEPNNASVAVLADVRGVRFLMTGDLEREAQDALVRAEPSLRADVLKVAHHGSADQADELVAAVGARVALISVGAGNRYGHPAQATLALLRRHGMLVARTDEDGAVALALDDPGAIHAGPGVATPAVAEAGLSVVRSGSRGQPARG